MKQEIIYTGKTVDDAVAAACAELGCEPDKLEYEVGEEAKGGLLGIGAVPARIKVTCSPDGGKAAKDFIETLIRDMDLEAEVELSVQKRSDRLISIKGEEAGILIGHHGDTLDALQYLTNLAANKREEEESRDYVHITVDIENYREKREATLRALARRTADKVRKYGKSVMLDIMPPNERRIVHSEIQGIEGISTNSIGVEGSRRVVVYLESAGFSVPAEAQTEARRGDRKPTKRGGHSDSGRNGSSDRRARRPKTQDKPAKPAAPKYNDGEEMSAEELSELISTYGTKDSKEKTPRDQPAKFKSFDDYLNSLLGDSDK